MQCNILFLVYIEKKELNIVMTSGEDGYIEVCGKHGTKYNIPSDVVLLHKKYYFDYNYNINESQLYSITSLFENYLVMNEIVYKLVNDHYKTLYFMLPNSTVKLSGISITYRSPDVYAFILPNRIIEKHTIRENCMLCIDPTCNSQLYFSHITGRPHILKTIDWSVINKITDIYKEQKVIIEISEYIKEININEILINIEEKIKNNNIKYDAIYYIYYFIEETCDLYLFISLIHYVRDRSIYVPTIYLRFLIVKHNILEPSFP
jgi:hypothetical protein